MIRHYYLAKLAQGGSNLNPLKSQYDTIPKFIDALLSIVIAVGFPVVVLGIVIVGFMFVMARGNEEALKKAKTAFLWVVIGAAIVLGAKVISSVVKNTVDQLQARETSGLVVDRLFANFSQRS